MLRRLLTAVTLLAVVASAGTVGATPASAAGSPHSRAGISMRLHDAVRSIQRGVEHPDGYDRDLFKHWIDADGDCQDTREEVLVAESLVPVGGCSIAGGEWFSYYDKETWTDASDVDIDHMVALKEAWDSGAWAWSDDVRMQYANDLGDARSLVAVTDNVNQSKGDRDPAEWLPEFGTCRYVRQWTVVKLRWRLRVDPVERAALLKLADACPNTMLRVTRAPR
jgi:hypothetical protein